MCENLTDMTVVLDRSGSMQQCKADAEVGLNAFVRQQAAQPGQAIFSLVQFDNVYEYVHRGVNLKKEIPICSIVPRHGTALLDAVGRALIETNERLRNIPENNRPDLVTFLIITDGEENSSQKFTKDRVKEMIEYQHTAYKWEFNFLGANQDAFAEAGGIGIDSSSSMDFRVGNISIAFAAASSCLSRMRHMSASKTMVCSSYSDEERELAGLTSLKRRIRLRGINGDAEGKVWESNNVLRAGRLANLEVILEDTSVSRRHAEIRRTSKGLRLRDLGSTNGTFLNGTRLGPGEWPIHHNDILRCGNVTLIVA